MNKNKVILTYYDAEENIAEETLWIEALDNNEYQIKNIPFFAPNIAYNDIIKVENDEGILYFDEIIKTSEHSTIQVVFFKTEIIEDVIKEIESLGCSWEGMDNQKLLAIDIPSNVNFNKIKEYLNDQFEKNVLDYKESCLSETHSQQIN